MKIKSIIFLAVVAIIASSFALYAQEATEKEQNRKEKRTEMREQKQAQRERPARRELFKIDMNEYKQKVDILLSKDDLKAVNQIRQKNAELKKTQREAIQNLREINATDKEKAKELRRTQTIKFREDQQAIFNELKPFIEKHKTQLEEIQAEINAKREAFLKENEKGKRQRPNTPQRNELERLLLIDVDDEQE